MPEEAELVVRIEEDADTAVRIVGDQVLDLAGAATGEIVTVEAGETLGTRTLAEAGIQPLDSDLTAIAALATTPFGRSLLTLANAAAALTAIGAQPADSDLTSIAALATTTYGRALLTLADRAALISLLALTEADVTNLTTDLAAKVAKSLFDANSLLVANADDTPLALVMAASTILGRKATGNIGALTPAEIRAILSLDVYAFRSGYYYDASPGTVSTDNSTVGNLILRPMQVDKAFTADRIGVEVTSNIALGTTRLGIYLLGTNGYPDAKLLDAGTVDTTTNGNKEITINQAVPLGVVAPGAVNQTAAATLRCHSSGARGVVTNSAVATNQAGWLQGAQTGVLPTNFGGNSTTSLAPRVFVRAA